MLEIKQPHGIFEAPSKEGAIFAASFATTFPGGDPSKVGGKEVIPSSQLAPLKTKPWKTP